MKKGGRHGDGDAIPYGAAHLARVFVLYLIAFMGFAGWIDLSSFDVFDPWLLIALAVVAAIVATFFHWRFGRRNPVDDLADGEL